MFKLNIHCEGDCSIDLESKAEITEIKNRNAIVTKPVKKILVTKEEKEILDIINDLHILGAPKKKQANAYNIASNENIVRKIAKEIEEEEERKRITQEAINFELAKKAQEEEDKKGVPTKKKIISKPFKSSDNCENIQGYRYNKNSCYLDSALFALFAFPSDFVRNNILELTDEEIKNKLVINLQGSKNKTSIDTASTYVILIRDILKRVVLKLQDGKSNVTNNFSTELRENLLGELEDSYLNPKNKKWNSGKEEDTEEFLRCLLDTFSINTLNKEELITYNKGDSFVKNNRIIQNELPIILVPVNTINIIDNTILNNTDKESSSLNNEYYNSTTLTTQSKNLQKHKKFLEINKLIVLLKTISISPISIITQPKYTFLAEILINLKAELSDSKKFSSKLDEIDLKLQDELYNEIKSLIKSKLAKESIQIFSELNKYRNDPNFGYYKKHKEFLDTLSSYSDSKVTTVKYQPITIDSENQYIIISIGRFSLDGITKNTKSIDYNQSIITPSGQKLDLNCIIIHVGTTIKHGHYKVVFRCNDMWYIYNNMGNSKGSGLIEKVGQFIDLLNNPEVKSNGVQFFYNNINPIL